MSEALLIIKFYHATAALGNLHTKKNEGTFAKELRASKLLLLALSLAHSEADLGTTPRSSDKLKHLRS